MSGLIHHKYLEKKDFWETGILESKIAIYHESKYFISKYKFYLKLYYEYFSDKDPNEFFTPIKPNDKFLYIFTINNVTDEVVSSCYFRIKN